MLSEKLFIFFDITFSNLRGVDFPLFQLANKKYAVKIYLEYVHFLLRNCFSWMFDCIDKAFFRNVLVIFITIFIISADSCFDSITSTTSISGWLASLPIWIGNISISWYHNILILLFTIFQGIFHLILAMPFSICCLHLPSSITFGFLGRFCTILPWVVYGVLYLCFNGFGMLST